MAGRASKTEEKIIQNTGRYCIHIAVLTDYKVTADGKRKQTSGSGHPDTDGHFKHLPRQISP